MVANITNKRDHIIFVAAKWHNDLSHVRSWIVRRPILARFFIEVNVDPVHCELQDMLPDARHEIENVPAHDEAQISPAALSISTTTGCSGNSQEYPTLPVPISFGQTLSMGASSVVTRQNVVIRTAWRWDVLFRTKWCQKC